MAIIDSNVYDDIDLFNLEGVKEIKHPTSYPYITIRDQGKLTKKVIYKYTATDSTERVYEKKESYWIGFYEFRADSGYNRTYEYIQPNKIVRLSYYGSYMKTGFHLDDIFVIEKDKSTQYSYWSEIGLYIEPNINNLDLIKNKINVIVKEELQRENGVLIIYSKSIDKIKNRIFETDTICYNIGEHSWFWLEKFGQNNKVECK